MANNSNLQPFKKGYDPRRGKKRKGSKHLSSLIREMASDPHFSAGFEDAARGKLEYTGAPIHAIVAVALLKAIDGDKDAREWIARHGWWKHSPEAIEPTGRPIQWYCAVPIGPPPENVQDSNESK